MRIGALATRTGVSVRALRYYESQGLLVAARDANGYRSYDTEAVARVAHLQVLYSAGLCSTRIADLLDDVAGNDRTIWLNTALADALSGERTRLEAVARDAAATLERLDRLIHAARTGRPAPIRRSSSGESSLTGIALGGEPGAPAPLLQ